MFAEKGSGVANGKALLWVSGVAAIVYIAFSVWRLVSVESYQESLEQSFDENGSNFLSELYATTSSLIYSSYIFLLVFALAIPLCAYRGISQKDRIILKWNYCASFGCVLILIFSLVNLFLTGDLCTETVADCSVLRKTYVFSIFLSMVLLILYGMSFLLSYRLSHNLNTSTSTSTVTTTSPTLQQLELREEVLDNVPYATPV